MASPTVTIRFVLQVLFPALLLMLLVILSCGAVNASAVKESPVNSTAGSFVTTYHMSGAGDTSYYYVSGLSCQPEDGEVLIADLNGCFPQIPFGNQSDGFICRGPCPNPAACTRLCSKGTAAIDLCSRCGLCLPNDIFNEGIYFILNGCATSIRAKSMLTGTMNLMDLGYDMDIVVRHP
ncbi:unnamed protein product [Calypogeia fissa]